MAVVTRLELVAGGSRKFWEVSVKGTDVIVRFGKVGTPGATKIVPEKTAQGARAQMHRLIGQKSRKGYRAPVTAVKVVAGPGRKLRRIRTTRQAIDAVLAGDPRKSAHAAALRCLGGQLPGGAVPSATTTLELRGRDEAERLVHALRALPDVPDKLVLTLVDGALDLLRFDEHRAQALPVIELLFDVAPAKPCKRGDKAHAYFLAVLNSALHQTFAARQFGLCGRIAELARPHARGDASIPHNAACGFAAVGRYDDALAMCRIAIEVGYEEIDRMRTDTDLGPLLKRREFKALFAA